MFYKRFPVFFAALLFLISSPSYAHQHKFRHYGMENGMNSNTVFRILQDRDGLMWFGTSEGLARYDGVSFKTWRSNPQDIHSLGNNTIYSLVEDERGVLYIGTENGLYSFDKNREIFDRILTRESLLDSVNDKFSIIFVRSMDVDNKGRLWIATLGQGLFRYDIHNKSLIHISAFPDNKYGTDSDYITSVLCDEKGRVWLTNATQYLYLFDEVQEKFSKIRIYDASNNVECRSTFSLCEDFRGNIWLGGWENGLFRYDREKSEFTSYRPVSENGTKLYAGRIHVIAETGPGIISYGCDNGIVNLNTTTLECENLRYAPYSNSSLTDNFIYDIVRDKEGGIWVATYFGGVNYTNSLTSAFDFSMTDRSGSRGRVISKFCEDADHKLWIGTDDGGLFLYNMASGQCQSKILDKDFPNLNIHALLKDDDGLWVGTYSHGLYFLDTDSGNVKHWQQFGEGSTTHMSVYALYRNFDGKLWIGTKTGIILKEGDRFRKILDLGFNNDIIDIQGDAYGNIWFSSINSGLMQFSSKTGMITRPSSKGAIPEKISSMACEDNIIWLGTSGNGLVRYDIQSGEVSQIMSGDVLTSDLTVFNIIADRQNLWLSSNSGLILYNTLTGKAKLFGAGDGLSANALNSNSGILTSDGVIFLGTNGGFNFFKPDDIQTNSTPPSLYLSNVEYANREATELRTSARTSGKMGIRTGDSHLNLKFSVLSYMVPEKNRFRWKIDDGLWRESVSGENEVVLTDLGRGEHSLTVSGCNNDGVWSEDKTLAVTVRPFWYNCTFALAMYALLVTAAVSLLIKFIFDFNRERKAGKQERIQRDRDRVRLETELELFTDIAREIRTPVMLINGPVDEILAEKGLSEKARKNAVIIKSSSGKLHTITHEILDFLHNSIEGLRNNIGDIDIPLRGEYRDISAEIEKSSRAEMQNALTRKKDSPKPREISLLIIDGDEQMREFLSLALSRHYKDVKTVADIDEARKTMNAGERIDLIISDAALAIDFCAELRSQDRFCHIPVFLLSSSNDVNLKVSAIEKGADIFLEKPVEIEFLISQINNILDKRKMMWDSFSKHPYATLRSTVQLKGNELFLQQLSDTVSMNISDIDFSVDDLAKQMNISRSVLFSQTREVCGTTPNNFIKEMRLRKAASLLTEQKYKVNEICYMVGFNTPSYFAKCFLKQFGVLPKDFMNEASE